MTTKDDNAPESAAENVSEIDLKDYEANFSEEELKHFAADFELFEMIASQADQSIEAMQQTLQDGNPDGLLDLWPDLKVHIAQLNKLSISLKNGGYSEQVKSRLQVILEKTDFIHKRVIEIIQNETNSSKTGQAHKAYRPN